MILVQARTSPLAMPAIRRLNAIFPLSVDAVEALSVAMRQQRELPARHEILTEGQEIKGTLVFVKGWAARVRVLPDGRKAVVSFILPGDLIGHCDHDRPVATSSVVALTPAWVCPAPGRDTAASLHRAYAVSRALDEAYLIGQVTRLGRLSGFERVVDFFLELLERLDLAGLAGMGRFDFPLTQEIVSDAVGLSPVHLNRMLQQARKSGALKWSGHKIVLSDPAALRELIGRQPVRVMATDN